MSKNTNHQKGSTNQVKCHPCVRCWGEGHFNPDDKTDICSLCGGSGIGY